MKTLKHTRFTRMYTVYEVIMELCHIDKFFLSDFRYSSNITKYFNQQVFSFNYSKIN